MYKNKGKTMQVIYLICNFEMERCYGVPLFFALLEITNSSMKMILYKTMLNIKFIFTPPPQVTIIVKMSANPCKD